MLVVEYMRRNNLQDQPFLKNLVDDLIEEIQGARLLRGALPLDRFAQTEMSGDRIEVTINSRIPEMTKVKDAPGVELISKFHESLHVDRDFKVSARPQLIVCRSASVRNGRVPLHEFVAENAALSAAIAATDLVRSRGFLRFQRLAAARGDLGRRGWDALYEVCAEIGVNISALVRYFGHLGLCQVIDDGNSRHLYVAPGPFRELQWWRPDCELIKF
jgi:hypothetical protein